MYKPQPHFCDRPDDERMKYRDLIERAGGLIVGYDGPSVQIAIPRPSGEFYAAMADAGFLGVNGSIHYYPLGSDAPEEQFRHDGRYPGSHGFWLYGRFVPRPRHTCGNLAFDWTCRACVEGYPYDE